VTCQWQPLHSPCGGRPLPSESSRWNYEVRTMRFLNPLNQRSRSRSIFLVARMSKDGHHFYSILASDSSFEFVFRSGHEHWSTISPSFAKRTMRLIEESDVQKPNSPKKYLDRVLTLLMSDTWSASSGFKYANREDALAFERKVLDNSWASKESDSDDE